MTMFAQDKNGEWQPVTMANDTTCLKTISHMEAEGHEGNLFFISGYTTLASGSSLNVTYTTPNTDARAWLSWDIESSGTLVTEFYEAPTGGMTGGATKTPYNADRNSATSSVMTIKSGVSDATSSNGTLLFEKKWTKREQADDSLLFELGLKQNTKYLRKFKSSSASNIVSFLAKWHEEPA